MERISKTKRGINENNGGLSMERLAIEENMSLRIISVDHRGGKKIIDRAKDYLQLESASLSDNGLAIKQIRSADWTGIASARSSDKRHVFLGMISLSNYRLDGCLTGYTTFPQAWCFSDAKTIRMKCEFSWGLVSKPDSKSTGMRKLCGGLGGGGVRGRGWGVYLHVYSISCLTDGPQQNAEAPGARELCVYKSGDQ